MRKQQFEVFHMERKHKSYNQPSGYGKVVDSQMPIVGKENAVSFALFLEMKSSQDYRLEVSTRPMGYRPSAPKLYYIRNLKTGRIMDATGKNSKAFGKDMTGIEQELERIEIPTSSHYNNSGCHSGDPCAVCGKDITNGAPKRLFMDYSTNEVIPPNNVDHDELDHGYAYIGSDCLRKNPVLKPYLV